MELTHQGRLFDAVGMALDGPHSLHLALYDASTGGGVQWQTDVSPDFDNGYFMVTLDGLDPAIFSGGTLYLAMTVDGGSELPDRFPLTSVPFAIHADTATQVDGGLVNATEVQVGGATVIDTMGRISATQIDGLPSAYLDSDAIAAMGAATDDNTLNHLRYTDADAIAAVGVHYTDADALAALGPHYTNADAIAAVGAHYTNADAIAAVGAHYTNADAIAAVGAHYTNADAIRAVGPHTSYDGATFALSGQGCAVGFIVTGVDATGQVTCVDGAAHTHTAADVGALALTGGALSGSLQLGDSGATCGAGDEGTLRWANRLEVCTAGGWANLVPAMGGSAATSGTSCDQLHKAYRFLGDGLYWVDSDGAGASVPYQVYCDMTTLGGGWTRVYYQDTAAGFFVADEFAKNVSTPTASRYAILDRLEDYRRNGDLEFMLRWPGSTTATLTQHWSQTSNPVTDTAGAAPTGYQALDINYTSNGWGGLQRGTGSALLDGTIVPTSNWYYAVGTFGCWTGPAPYCMPGPSVAEQVVELLIR